MNTIAIKNPGDEGCEAGFVDTVDVLTPEIIIRDYGQRIENGAIVTMVEGNRVWVYVADRENISEGLILRSSNSLVDYVDLEDAGYEVDRGIPAAEVALSEFTVFGVNDNDEAFVTVCTAKDADAAALAAKTTCLVDPGYEYMVKIAGVLPGDRREEIEQTNA